MKRYGTIYADPPWRYAHMITRNRAIENQYPTMTLGDICDLRVSVTGEAPRPVADLAAPDSVLFLWSTSPLLREALQVMDAWGFAYVTQLVWDKCRIGMGYWWRQRHETLLLGKRGHPPPPPPEARTGSVVQYMRARHSQKPSVFYEMIELMSPGPRLELFARQEWPGWDAWGNEDRQMAAL